MTKPNQAQVRCICGNLVTVQIGGKPRRCKCGVALSVKRNRGGQVTPWAFLCEDSAAERKRAGKPVKHRAPKIVTWIWPAHTGGKFCKIANAT